MVVVAGGSMVAVAADTVRAGHKNRSDCPARKPAERIR